MGEAVHTGWDMSEQKSTRKETRMLQRPHPPHHGEHDPPQSTRQRYEHLRKTADKTTENNAVKNGTKGHTGKNGAEEQRRLQESLCGHSNATPTRRSQPTRGVTTAPPAGQPAGQQAGGSAPGTAPLRALHSRGHHTEESCPVSERREHHERDPRQQVVIIAGETGSGKPPPPKMCLDLDLGEKVSSATPSRADSPRSVTPNASPKNTARKSAKPAAAGSIHL